MLKISRKLWIFHNSAALVVNRLCAAQKIIPNGLKNTYATHEAMDIVHPEKLSVQN